MMSSFPNGRTEWSRREKRNFRVLTREVQEEARLIRVPFGFSVLRCASFGARKTKGDYTLE